MQERAGEVKTRNKQKKKDVNNKQQPAAKVRINKITSGPIIAFSCTEMPLSRTFEHVNDTLPVAYKKPTIAR